MSFPLTRFLVSRMKLELVLVVVVFAAVTLLQPDPIRSRLSLDGQFEFNQWLFLLMSLVGIFLPTRICNDSPGVAVWLQSRGLSRRQQFLSRFAVGVFVLLGLTLLISLLAISGLRQVVQNATGSPWFPMVRWYEVGQVLGIFLWGWIPYAFTFLAVTAVQNGSAYPNLRLLMCCVAGFCLMLTLNVFVNSWILIIGLTLTGFVCAAIAGWVWNAQEQLKF